MENIQDVIFICLDCETTGLNKTSDEVIEFAAVKFSISKGIIDSMHTMIKPSISIPLESQKIHNITNEMVADAPSLKDEFQNIIDFIEYKPIVGHVVSFDLSILQSNANRLGIVTDIGNRETLDTFRLSKHSQNSKSNSLVGLCKHLGIDLRTAHRAMDDVLMNIELFKRIALPYKTLENIRFALSRPLQMEYMPFGRYKGQKVSSIPLKYLLYIQKNSNFDKDLKYTIDKEIQKRSTNSFDSWNPFKLIN